MAKSKNPKRIHREMKATQRSYQDKYDNGRALTRHETTRIGRIEWMCGKMQQTLHGPIDLR